MTESERRADEQARQAWSRLDELSKMKRPPTATNGSAKQYLLGSGYSSVVHVPKPVTRPRRERLIEKLRALASSPDPHEAALAKERFAELS